MIKHLVAGTAIALALCSCSFLQGTNTSTPAGTVNSVISVGTQDLKLVAGALPGIAAALQQAGTLTAAQVADVNTNLSKAVSAANTLASQPAINSNDPVLAQFSAGANALLAVAANVLPGNPAVIAAEVILPIAEGVASQLMPGAAAAMTADQARAVLRAAARK